MTGFGKATLELPDKKIYTEIKTLNSKQFDYIVRVPFIYREKEIEIRNKLSNKLLRGKIDLMIMLESPIPEKKTKLNLSVINDYYSQLNNFAFKYNIDNNTDYLKIILSMPDTLSTEIPQLDEEEWLKITLSIDEAIDDVDKFRMQEGKILEDDMTKRANAILDALKQIETFENQRIEKIKTKIRENIEEIIVKEKIDENRLEQELIYYIEKLDFTEEKIRLKNHIEYFFETLKEDQPVGKKIGFIIQEMGREINTLGSKAYNADIQKIIIIMKDELEKIKEQSSNIL